jgi:hypothetical protein
MTRSPDRSSRVAADGARSPRARASCLALLFAASLACAPALATQSVAQPATVPTQDPASTAALLASSEIAVVESGGIAGRVHSARFVAADGRVSVEYRPREVSAVAAPFTGAIEPEPFVALWRQLEKAGVWNVRSSAAGKGADLVQVELRIRSGDRAHVVRWDDAALQKKEFGDLAEAARRALALGGAAAFAR